MSECVQLSPDGHQRNVLLRCTNNNGIQGNYLETAIEPSQAGGGLLGDAYPFISFWRAAAIVLNDLGSSAFYAGGIAEEAVGKSAPWFIMGVMLFSFGVRTVYVESCSMFTRGGVYRIVKEALGGTFAKLSVSALMFDYILTGPISAVSAGQLHCSACSTKAFGWAQRGTGC